MAWTDHRTFVTEVLRTGAVNSLDLVFGQENGLNEFPFNSLWFLDFISTLQNEVSCEKEVQSNGKVNKHSFYLNDCPLLMQVEICIVILKAEDLHF